jgi:hypothetical protein
MVAFACGHEKPVADFKGTACGECRNKARQAKNARRRAKEGTKPPGPQLDQQGRLPHAAVFTVQYDAVKQQWSGTLAIPDQEDLAGATAEFIGSASGVERLLRDLAGQYRASCREG